MKRLLTLAAAIMMLLPTACNRQTFTATTTYPLELRHASKKKENAVQIYQKYQDAPADAEQLGFMASSSFNPEKVAVKVRNFAARAGGNVAVFVDKDEMLQRKDVTSNTYVPPALLQKKYNYVILKTKGGG